MWPMEKIRGTMQSIDQQLKENRNRVSALEQAAADQQLRTEVVLNQLRQEKAHLKDCWQNEQEKTICWRLCCAIRQHVWKNSKKLASSEERIEPPGARSAEQSAKNCS